MSVKRRQVGGANFTLQVHLSCEPCNWQTVTIRPVADIIAAQHEADPEHLAMVGGIDD